MITLTGFTRQKDRRSSERGNSLGRRAHERYIICDSLNAILKMDNGEHTSADILDLSKSGMHVVSCSDNFRPSVGQNVQITFFDDSSENAVNILGLVRYVSNEAMELIDMIGFGVSFSHVLDSKDFYSESSAVSLFGRMFNIVK